MFFVPIREPWNEYRCKGQNFWRRRTDMIVSIKNGKIRGIKEKGMIAFKGIPFGEAPVGEFRFQPPVPAKDWEGILDADKYGFKALQAEEHGHEKEYGFSEDCLNLNVWIPDTKGEKRPVIFYIHGGGHIGGSNGDAFLDGPNLIRGREAIMVSVNYRLGAFGYLYLGDILGEEYKNSGNCGLLDQLLALRWVRDNIAAFGGDSNMVILMGQSAGAKSVANIMASPHSKGLYHRAIIQSGALQSIRDTHTATELTKIVLKKLGIENSPKDILTKTGEEIIEAQKEAFEDIDSIHLFGPVADGHTLPIDIEEYFKKGNVTHIPILIGYNKEENCGFQCEGNIEEQIIEHIKKSHGFYWKPVYELYQEYKKSNLQEAAYDKARTTSVYGNATMRLTKLLAMSGNSVWSYRWDYGGLSGNAHHCCELDYVFNRFLDEEEKNHLVLDKTIGMTMNETWMSFVLTGNPNNKYMIEWNPCSSEEEGYRMYFDKEFHLEPYLLTSFYKELPLQVIKL